MGKTATMTDKEKEKRVIADILAHHELRLEGFERNPETEHIHQAWVEGKISGDQLRAAILEHYKIKPKV